MTAQIGLPKLFQSTHPLRGATFQCRQRSAHSTHFNPRTPCGVRPAYFIAFASFLNFNPRTPCGVRQRGRSEATRYRNFNPRTPCGVRLFCASFLRIANAISIHAPLAGCDACAPTTPTALREFQSTHPLRGATMDHNKEESLCTISIHAPLAGCDYSVGFRLKFLPNFNPRTPCGVRRIHNQLCTEKDYFNPRTPCGVRLCCRYAKPVQEYFNPRTPCGVRPSMGD